MSGIRIIAARARGLTLAAAAAALAITTLAAPASAQLNENAGKLALADIEVIKHGFLYDAGLYGAQKVKVWVKNPSPHRVTVKITKYARLNTKWHELSRYSPREEDELTLLPEYSHPVVVECKPGGAEYCAAIGVDAVYSLDPNTANNSGSWTRLPNGTWTSWD